MIDGLGKQLAMFRDLQNGEFLTQNTVNDGVIYPIAFPNIALEIQKLVSIPE